MEFQTDRCHSLVNEIVSVCVCVWVGVFVYVLEYVLGVEQGVGWLVVCMLGMTVTAVAAL